MRVCQWNAPETSDFRETASPRGIGAIRMKWTMCPESCGKKPVAHRIGAVLGEILIWCAYLVRMHRLAELPGRRDGRMTAAP
jgi:hypothetical protein